MKDNWQDNRFYGLLFGIVFGLLLIFIATRSPQPSVNHAFQTQQPVPGQDLANQAIDRVSQTVATYVPKPSTSEKHEFQVDNVSFKRNGTILIFSCTITNTGTVPLTFNRGSFVLQDNNGVIYNISKDLQPVIVQSGVTIPVTLNVSVPVGLTVRVTIGATDGTIVDGIRST